jgi:5-formyltetrahydrofolate cyclo-ligase
LSACSGAAVVAAYSARPEEPATAELIEALWRSGVRVLLPVLTLEPDWAWYAGSAELTAGPRGIAQPTGPRLGAAALSSADWIWLPGLAGAPDGRRLGTGGGWYDRALIQARPNAVRGLLLFDTEVLDELPTDPWDQPVNLLVTELRQIVCVSE